MGIKVDIGSADSQGSTANSVLSSRVNYYNDVISAFNNLITEEELKGKAYDSAKSYAENIMVPLLRGVILFSESLGGKAGELPTLYRSQVGGESLDEEILQQQIEAKNTTISTYESILYSLYNLKDVNPIYISNVRGVISNATSKRDELQRKLEKLQSFASSTSGHFSDSESLQTLVFQGFEQVTGDFASFGGTFPKHSGKTLNWAKSIEGEWDKKAKIDEDYQKVLEKIKDGKELNEDDVKKIDAYKNRYSNRELPENVKEAVKEEHRRNSKEISKEEAASILGIPSWNEILGDAKSGTEAVFTYRGAKVFLNGIEITVDNKGRMRWGNKFIYKQSYLYSNGEALEKASGLDLENYHYSGNLKGMARFKEMGKAGWSGFKEAVNPLNDFKGWKEVGKFGKAAKGAGIFLTAWNVKDNWEKNVNVKDGISAKEVRDFAIDTTVDIGSGAAATGVGAMVGSAFLPPLGTVVGAGVGASINYLMNNYKFNGASLVDHTKKELKKWGDEIGKFGNNVFKTIGNWLG